MATIETKTRAANTTIMFHGGEVCGVGGGAAAGGAAAGGAAAAGCSSLRASSSPAITLPSFFLGLTVLMRAELYRYFLPFLSHVDIADSLALPWLPALFMCRIRWGTTMNAEEMIRGLVLLYRPPLRSVTDKDASLILRG
jgi:hypothetical protein